MFRAASAGQIIYPTSAVPNYACSYVDLDPYAAAGLSELVGVATELMLVFRPTYYTSDPLSGYYVREDPPYFVERDEFEVPDLTERNVYTLQAQLDGQGLTGRNQVYQASSNQPRRMKLLYQYISQISGGTDRVASVYLGYSSALVITQRGRLITWSLRQATLESAALTFVSDSTAPILGDRLAFLGSFEPVKVLATRRRLDDTSNVYGGLFLINRT